MVRVTEVAGRFDESRDAWNELGTLSRDEAASRYDSCVSFVS